MWGGWSVRNFRECRFEIVSGLCLGAWAEVEVAFGWLESGETPLLRYQGIGVLFFARLLDDSFQPDCWCFGKVKLEMKAWIPT